MCAAQWVPAGEPIVIEVDDSTKKKAGTQIEGVAHYRNGAGSARQEYRTLRGLNFVWGIMRVPLPRWPGQRVSVPIGLSLYLKEEQAQQLNVPYQSRSALAREIVDFVAAQLPDAPAFACWAMAAMPPRTTCSQLPATVHVVGRMLITGKLYAPAAAARAAPRVSPEERPVAGVAENVGPQTERLAAPSHRSRGARPSVDGAVAYRLAGTRDPGGGRPPPHAATAPPAQAAQTPPARGSVFHHRSHAESGGDPRPVSRPVGRGNYDSR